jgi:hypothetical protein
MKKAFMIVAEKHIVNETHLWFKEFIAAAKLNKIYEAVEKKHLTSTR